MLNRYCMTTSDRFLADLVENSPQGRANVTDAGSNVKRVEISNDGTLSQKIKRNCIILIGWKNDPSNYRGTTYLFPIVIGNNESVYATRFDVIRLKDPSTEQGLGIGQIRDVVDLTFDTNDDNLITKINMHNEVSGLTSTSRYSNVCYVIELD